jgi:hypothetical protein
VERPPGRSKASRDPNPTRGWLASAAGAYLKVNPGPADAGGVNRDIRAALIGGLAATLVVAASLAPKLVGGPGEVTVRNSSTDAALAVDDTTTSTTASADTTTSTAPAPTTTTAPSLAKRVDKVEERVTVIEKIVTTTTAPAKPDVSFYFEGTVGIGPDAEAAPYDGTWKVVFRTTHTEPGLRVRYVAQTKTGPAEFVAEFSDLRPMYTHTAVGRIDATLLDVPANPPRQSANRVFFEKIVAVEWDGGSQTF